MHLPVCPVLVHVGVGFDQRYPVVEGGREEPVLLGATRAEVFKEPELICLVAADDVLDGGAETKDEHQVAHAMKCVLRWEECECAVESMIHHVYTDSRRDNCLLTEFQGCAEDCLLLNVLTAVSPLDSNSSATAPSICKPSILFPCSHASAAAFELNLSNFVGSLFCVPRVKCDTSMPSMVAAFMCLMDSP